MKTLKIDIIKDTTGEDFEQLVELLKEFVIETFIKNKPEYSELKIKEEVEIINKAISEFEGKEQLSMLQEKDIEQIKEDLESQIESAKNFINNKRDNVETRYYVLKDENEIVSFQQVQVSKNEKSGRIEGWRNLAYAKQEYRGKEKLKI